MHRSLIITAGLVLWFVSLPTAQSAPPARSTPPVSIETTIDISTNYFDVAGSNSYQIRAAIVQARPWKTNEFFDAVTEWKVSWRYRFANDDQGYRLQSASIHTRVSLTMPRVQFLNGTHPNVVQHWNNYLNSLTEHELGHVKIARQATAAVRKALQGLGVFSSTQDLREAARRAGDKAVAEHVQKEKEYDRSTRHGAAQWGFADRASPPSGRFRSPPPDN